MGGVLGRTRGRGGRAVALLAALALLAAGPGPAAAEDPMEDLEAQAAAKPDLDADALRALVEGEDQSPEKMEGLLHWAITNSDPERLGIAAEEYRERLRVDPEFVKDRQRDVRAFIKEMERRPTEAQQMEELLKKVREGEGGLQVGPSINSEKIAALEELAVLVESLDNAGDFAMMGGVKAVYEVFKLWNFAYEPYVMFHCAKVLASAGSNNLEFIEQMLRVYPKITEYSVVYLNHFHDKVPGEQWAWMAMFTGQLIRASRTAPTVSCPCGDEAGGEGSRALKYKDIGSWWTEEKMVLGRSWRHGSILHSGVNGQQEVLSAVKMGLIKRRWSPRAKAKALTIVEDLIDVEVLDGGGTFHRYLVDHQLVKNIVRFLDPKFSQGGVPVDITEKTLTVLQKMVKHIPIYKEYLAESRWGIRAPQTIEKVIKGLNAEMGKAQGETQGFFKEVIGKAEALLQDLGTYVPVEELTSFGSTEGVYYSSEERGFKRKEDKKEL